MVTNCAVNLEASLYQSVDWRSIDFLDIGGGQLLADGCIGRSTVKDYVSFIRSMVLYVRGKNPKIIIDAHLSFGSIQPSKIAEAIQAVSGDVDGFLLAYPLAPDHQHKYSNVQNLETVLRSLRTPYGASQGIAQRSFRRGRVSAPIIWDGEQL